MKPPVPGVEACKKVSGETQVVPGSLSGLAARLYTRLGLANRVRPFLNTVITNVPGPQVPLYFTGAKMVGLFGLGPIMDGMGLIHPVFSYSGRISISGLHVVAPGYSTCP